jgi:chromosome segregation ATPase
MTTPCPTCHADPCACETPRCDASEKHADSMTGIPYVVFADFARQLERELLAAQRQLANDSWTAEMQRALELIPTEFVHNDMWYAGIGRMAEALTLAQRQLAEVTREMERYRQAYDIACDERTQLRAELAEASKTIATNQANALEYMTKVEAELSAWKAAASDYATSPDALLRELELGSSSEDRIDQLRDENEKLREALKGVIRVADRKTVEFDAAHAALKA